MTTAPSPLKHHPTFLLAGQLAALFLLILGCKFWLIATYSSPLPLLDQWKGEGAEVLQPWMKGELRAGDLLAPFNEHRIVPTRILTLGLFAANGRQWDAQVAMTIGAGLHALCAVVLGLLLIERLDSPDRGPILAALSVVFGLTFDWQNTLWGFQSQFYFLILFTLGAFWGLAGAPSGSGRWWCGGISALFACLSMGSGGFAGLAVALWLSAKLLLHPELRHQRGTWITVLLSAAFFALSLALYRPPQAESLAVLHATSVGSFVRAFLIHLSWPSNASPLFAILTYAPLALLLWCRWRNRSVESPHSSVDDLLFLLGLWVMLHAAALAWSRNHPMTPLISRYTDILALGALVNFCALLHLRTRLPAFRWKDRAIIAGTVVWVALFFVGLAPLLQRNFRLDLPSLQKIQQHQTAAVRQFLVTGQTDDLGGKRVFGIPPSEIPMLAELLRDPLIQNALPVGIGVRRNLAPPGLLTSTSRFFLDGWIFFVGSGAAALFFLTLRQTLRSRRISEPAVVRVEA